MTINILKNKNDAPIKDAYSFTDFPSYNPIGLDCISEDYFIENEKIFNKKNYTINLDWLQFIAIKIVNIDFKKLVSENFIVSEKVNNNPNFKSCYMIIKNNIQILKIYVNPANKCFKNNEVLIKVENHMLYVNDYLSIVNSILLELRLKFSRITKIDIALDGADILRVMDFLRKFTRNKTIQIGNNNLKVDPGNLNKKDLTFENYRIGNKKAQKSAIVYKKSDEIKKSNKEYITKWWFLNGIDTTQKIGRFEVQLNYQHLKKYQMNSLDMLMDINFIGSIFKNEVKEWFRMYQVKLIDINHHRKDIAIRKGKEIILFYWEKIPTSVIGISQEDVRIDPIVNAKRSTSFSVQQLVNSFLDNDTTTGSTIEYIINTTNRFDLESYTERKLEQEFEMHEKLSHADKTFIRDELRNRIEKSNRGNHYNYSNGFF